MVWMVWMVWKVDGVCMARRRRVGQSKRGTGKCGVQQGSRRARARQGRAEESRVRQVGQSVPEMGGRDPSADKGKRAGERAGLMGWGGCE